MELLPRRCFQATGGRFSFFFLSGAGGDPGLADDAADGLQRRELLAVSDVQGLVGDEVLGGQNLPAGGAHLAVQLGRRRGRRGRRLPGVLLVAVFLSSSSAAAARLPLRRLAVSVGREQLLLLRRVRQQHQQLVEDAVEVVAEQLLAAAVVVGRRYRTLEAQREQKILAFQGDKRKKKKKERKSRNRRRSDPGNPFHSLQSAGRHLAF